MIDPRTKAGLYEAIRLYWGALEDCNARNGFGSLDAPLAAPAPVIVVPATSTKTTVQKVTTAPTGASVSTPLPSPVDVVRDLAK